MINNYNNKKKIKQISKSTRVFLAFVEKSLLFWNYGKTISIILVFFFFRGYTRQNLGDHRVTRIEACKACAMSIE